MRAISRAYSRKNTRKFNKLRDMSTFIRTYVCWRTCKLSPSSRLIRCSSLRPGSSWWRGTSLSVHDNFGTYTFGTCFFGTAGFSTLNVNIGTVTFGTYEISVKSTSVHKMSISVQASSVYTKRRPNVAQAGAVASQYPPCKWLKFAELPCLEQTNSTRLDME